MMKKAFLFVAAIAAMTFSFNNCAQNRFSGENAAPATGDTGGVAGARDAGTITNTDGAGGGVQAVGTGGGSGGGGSGGGSGGGGSGGGGSGGGGSGGTPPIYGGGVDPVVAPTLIPSITYYAPDCAPKSWCPVTFRIYGGGAELTYNWKTNDSKFGQAPPAGVYPYGQAAIDYVSTFGIMIFAPGGSTSIVIRIQNISNQTTKFTIPLYFDKCFYAGKPINCPALKFTQVLSI
jgi:hypothetical protein